MSFALRSMTQTAPCGIKACLSIIYYYDATPQDSPCFRCERGWKEIKCVQHYKAPGGGFPHARASIDWLRGHVHSFYVLCDNMYNYVMSCAAQSRKRTPG